MLMVQEGLIFGWEVGGAILQLGKVGGAILQLVTLGGQFFT